MTTIRLRPTHLLFLFWLFANGVALGFKLSFDDSVEEFRKNLHSLGEKLP